MEKGEIVTAIDGWENVKFWYFECACRTHEHLLRFMLDPDDEWMELTASIYLNPNMQWYKRLWHGLRYIFGYSEHPRSARCDFDNWILCRRDAEKMKRMIEDYLKLKGKQDKEV